MTEEKTQKRKRGRIPVRFACFARSAVEMKRREFPGAAVRTHRMSCVLYRISPYVDDRHLLASQTVLDMPKHIIMTGATGLIGSRLYSALRKRGDRITVLTRNTDKAGTTFTDAESILLWAPGVTGEWKSAIDGADAVVHLAGEPISEGRWTDEYKKRIHDSRVQGTREIVDAIGAAREKPELLLCVSAVGYYGDTKDTVVDENSPPGDDFLAQTCVDWENEARQATSHNVRVVIPRLGIVLAENGGALEKLLTPFKMFAGGPIGNGEQWFPWVHIDDVVGIFLHALEQESVTGELNAVSPDPLRNRDFAIALGEALGRPARFSVPAFIIKLAMGEFGETLLGGQRAQPVRTLESGYSFEYPTLKEALADLLQ